MEFEPLEVLGKNHVGGWVTPGEALNLIKLLQSFGVQGLDLESLGFRAV